MSLEAACDFTISLLHNAGGAGVIAAIEVRAYFSNACKFGMELAFFIFMFVTASASPLIALPPSQTH